MGDQFLIVLQYLIRFRSIFSNELIEIKKSFSKKLS